MNRRQAVQTITAGASLAALGSRGAALASLARKPNILVFVADDAGARHFGCYGNAAVQTPNIDRLAAEGTLAEKAMLTTSQCSPSRISILTGLYPHATGAEDLHMPLPDDGVILPTHLHKAGYFTGHMQKRHEGRTADHQFQWYDPGLEHFDDFLDAAGERPFFMWVAFDDPHRPYSAGDTPQRHDPADVSVPPYMADTPETRGDLAQYLNEIARMDDVIGRHMAELGARGLDEDTLVIFLSDNGAPFPREKGTLYDTGVRTPLIFRWPGVVPANRRHDGLMSVIDLAPSLLSLAGVEIPAAMQGRDISAGLEDPSLWRRRSAFSERNWHDCDEHMRSIRTERFRLVHNAYISLPFCTPGDVSHSPSWGALFERKQSGNLTTEQARLFAAPRPEIEFYDCDADRWQLTNLAAEPAYRDEIRHHFVLLQDWMNSTGDFPPHRRRRDGYVDRVTGVLYTLDIPDMYNR